MQKCDTMKLDETGYKYQALVFHFQRPACLSIKND